MHAGRLTMRHFPHWPRRTFISSQSPPCRVIGDAGTAKDADEVVLRQCRRVNTSPQAPGREGGIDGDWCRSRGDARKRGDAGPYLDPRWSQIRHPSVAQSAGAGSRSTRKVASRGWTNQSGRPARQASAAGHDRGRCQEGWEEKR